MKITDYDRLACALARIAMGKGESGESMTMADARHIAELALTHTRKSKIAIAYADGKVKVI